MKPRQGFLWTLPGCSFNCMAGNDKFISPALTGLENFIWAGLIGGATLSCHVGLHVSNSLISTRDLSMPFFLHPSLKTDFFYHQLFLVCRFSWHGWMTELVQLSFVWGRLQHCCKLYEKKTHLNYSIVLIAHSALFSNSNRTGGSSRINYGSGADRLMDFSPFICISYLTGGWLCMHVHWLSTATKQSRWLYVWFC